MMGRPLIDRTGQVFHRLTVLATTRVVRGTRAVTRLVCRCECGNVVTHEAGGVIAGVLKSCGCFRRDYRRSQWLRHGEAVDYERQTPEYNAWRGMRHRVRSTEPQRRRSYLDRGITVCAEWQASYEAFLAHVGRKPAPGLTLDRINNDGHYEPGNVRWATKSEQARNRRRPQGAR